MSSLHAQNQNVFANVDEWKLISTNNFDIYFPATHQGGANLAARYAERARFELGVLFDYKPESRYTLVYASDAQSLLNSNLEFDRPDHVPGIFHLPQRHGVVIHPETKQLLYQRVKKEVASLILKDFTYGTRFGTTFQSQLLLYDAPWFHDGLAEYVASGWTYEDQMMMSSMSIDGLLDLALEGNQAIHRLVRKSIWHFITHEYGEQKISEIIYLVNISYSIESGVISVLGINLNTLTARWKEFLTVRAESQMNKRYHLEDIPTAIFVPLESKQELTAFAYNASQSIVALHVSQGEKQSIDLYDLATKKRIPTPIKYRSSRQDAEQFEKQASMAWDPNGQILVSTVYHRGSYALAYLDRESNTVTTVPLPEEIRQVQQISWSRDGSRLLVSALNSERGSFDIYRLDREGENLTALTADPFDNLDPVWGADADQIYFSSNRDTVEHQWEGSILG